MKHTTPRHVTPTAYRAGFPAIVSSQSSSSGVFLRASVSWVAKILHIRGSLTTAHGKCLSIVSGTLSAQGEISAADDDYWKFLDKTALALSLSVSLRAIYRNDCDENNILIGEQRSVIVVVVIPKVCNETSGWVDMEISMHIGCCHLRDINDLFKNV